MDSAYEDIKVSIIIPSRNEGDELHTTVQKVLDAARNDSVPYDITVVDDYSTPKVKRRKGYNLVRNSEQLGCGLSKNRGVNESDGNVILFLDAHSRVEDGFLTAYGQAFADEDRTPAMVCVKHRWFGDSTDLMPAGRQYSPDLIPWQVEEYTVDGIAEIPSGLGCGMAVRRDAMMRAGGFCELFWPIGGEDFELPMRFHALNLPVYGISTTTVHSLLKESHDTVDQDTVQAWANMIIPSILHWPAGHVSYMWEQIRALWTEWPDLFESVWQRCHQPEVMEFMRECDRAREVSRDVLFNRFPVREEVEV